jgi:UDP-glucose 4-epimerase
MTAEKIKVLVTGGAGYIGSHTCVRLIEAGFEPLILDNFCNSKPAVLASIERITGQRPTLVEGDVRDLPLLKALLSAHRIEAVLHFAGLKAVGDSVREPTQYYDNNVYGSQVLIQALESAGVQRLIFSSSATVYGDPVQVPVDENSPLGATNPYGRSKLMVEQMLGDLVVARPEWSVLLLRYFNPVGAHPSGLMGEDPCGVPNNLMPFIAQVAVGRRPQLNIFGSDYPTPDGTGVRDYIHVLDLADGHVAALRHALAHPGLHTYNLGTGQGHSVLEVMRAFERASGRRIAHQLGPRRPGDIAACWANPAKAQQELGWQARLGLAQMCAHTWHWQSTHPNGFEAA